MAQDIIGDEPFVSNDEKRLGDFHGDTLSVYSQLLGLGERRLPEIEDFPKAIKFPTALLGPFFQDISDINKLDPSETGRAIFWNKKISKIETTSKMPGNRTNAYFDSQFIRTYFGPKALLEYHLHPSADFDFSHIDISRMLSFPRIAYIFSVGTEFGAAFAFQSNKTAKLPILPVVNFLSTLYDIFIKLPIAKIGELDSSAIMDKDVLIDIVTDKVLDEIKLSKGGEYLHTKGFSGYIWKPEKPFNFLKPPEFLTLERFDSLSLQ